MRLTRILLWAVLVALAGTIFLPLAAWQFPFRLGPPELYLGLGLLLLSHLALGLGCAVPLEQGRARGWMRSGLIAATVSFITWMMVIVFQTPLLSAGGERFGIWPTTWAALMMVIGLLLLPRSHGRLGRGLRTAAIVLAATSALALTVSYTFHPMHSTAHWAGSTRFDYEYFHRYDEIAGRTVTSLLLLTAGLVIVTFLSLVMRRMLGHATPAMIKPLQFECPRCGVEQCAHTGDCQCQACGLTVKVHLS